MIKMMVLTTRTMVKTIVMMEQKITRIIITMTTRTPTTTAMITPNDNSDDNTGDITKDYYEWDNTNDKTNDNDKSSNHENSDHKKVCWKDQDFIGCPTDYPEHDYHNWHNHNWHNHNWHNHKGHGNYNHNNNNNNNNNNDKQHESNTYEPEKFNVHAFVDFGQDQSDQKYSMRVIVYGPHTLNKPTLDKPETPIYLGSCGYNEVCYQDAGVWGFTSWKVPQGASFKVCVTSNNGNVSCDWGYADSKRWESIHVSS